MALRTLLPHLVLALPPAACVTVPAQPKVHPATSAAPAPASAPSADESAIDALPWTELARSVDDRPVRQALFGHGPRRVLLVGGIHGDEREGARAALEIGPAVLAQPGAEERVTLLVIEDLNPDGSARRRRGNARGIDLNRNFPAANFVRGRMRAGSEPLSEPESRALFELVTSWRPDLVVVLHSWRSMQFVNFDGPARLPAERFAARTGFALRESKDLEPTPGSLGSWAAERELALLTIEYRRGTAPEAAWAATGAALVELVLGP